MPGDRILFTYRKVPLKIGLYGGISFPKKLDQVYPFDYIDKYPGGFEIDYVTFIKYSINTFEDILISLIDGVETKRELERYFLNIIMKYDKIFELQYMCFYKK